MSKNQIKLKPELQNDKKLCRQLRISYIRIGKGSRRKKRLPSRRDIAPEISVEGYDEVLPKTLKNYTKASS